MTVTLIFLAVLMALFAGWLLSQSFNVQPWVAHSATAPQMPPAVTAPRVGLAVFLAVATSLFALTVSAYMMRMHMGADWRPMPAPALLWANTGILLLGSIGLQRAWNAAREGRTGALRRNLIAGGAGAIAFIGGQYLVWRQLEAAGYYLSSNPANAFFYLLTALHALHLAGGLVAWAGALSRMRRGAAPEAVLVRVELCAVYWHYLFVLWVVLFGLVSFT
jgi:cytochrome c oxidase subunit 3